MEEALHMDRPGVDLTSPLTDPAFYADDPHALYTRLRLEAPVAWCENPGFWVLSKHQEVFAVSTDNTTFRSGKGVLLRDIGTEPPEIPGALLYVDPPDHTRYRKLIQPAFSPQVTDRYEKMIRERTRVLVDKIEPGQTIDFTAAVAVPLPIQVIASLLGVAEDEWPKFYEWSDAFIAAADGDEDAPGEVLVEAIDYLMETVQARRAEPAEDLISKLGMMDLDGDRLSDGELQMFLVQLLVAGNETTRNLLSGGVAALAARPDQWQRLAANPDLIRTSVEEMLRYSSPVISFLRTATRDTRLGDQDIAEGEPVLMIYASANRDEAHFGENSQDFEIDRHPSDHLSFGFGAHFCIGARLARLEARVLCEELLDRFTGIEAMGTVKRVPSTVIAGISSCPVRFSE